MKIGDLVTSHNEASHPINDVGIVIEVRHPGVKKPDYRTPTAVLVFYARQRKDGAKTTQEIWFSRSELKLINEG